MPSNSPTILDVWSHIEPRFGGVGPAAAALAGAVQHRSGWITSQVAVCDPEEVILSDGVPKTVQTLPLSGPRGLSDRKVRQLLNSQVAGCDVCHVHGIWLAHSVAVRSLAKRLHKPIVSSVHGMLEKWELANKRLKKQLYSAFVERPSLVGSSCLRALSQQEADDYRRFGLSNPIAIVPNGIDPLAKVDTSDFLDRHPQLRDKQIVLFLGRIHHKKGILDLLNAWPAISLRHPEAHLLIAGAEYENTGHIAREIIENRRISERVTFAGVLSGPSKLAALSIAHVFCLPSYSEGLSMAVLESLSIGLPVVITRACNVDGIEESGAGYLISNRSEEITSVLSNALSLTGSEWMRISESASSLARSRYDWSIAAKAMHSVYEWLLGGPKPDCVTG